MELKSINDLSRHIEPIFLEIQQAITDVVMRGWFVLGNEVYSFEKEFARYCGITHCITVANGTDALEIALKAVGLGPGSLVLTVANAGTYSTAAILSIGAVPVFVDVMEDTCLVDLADLDQVLSEQKVDAIIVTHLFGMLAPIQKIVDIAKCRSTPVIEDCAQAHGALIGGKRAGAFGDVACFSFYPTKNLGALGDGGAIITNIDVVAKRARQLRQYGWDSKYCSTVAGGRNSRLDEIQAAVLRVKLPYLDRWNSRRCEIAARYKLGIDNPKVATLHYKSDSYVAHLYVVKTPERESLKKHLELSGIPSDVHYPLPDYRQPAFSQLFWTVKKSTTEKLCDEILTLPCFPEMTDAEVDTIVDCINDWA